MLKSEMIAAATAAANAYEIERQLVCSIVEQESEWNPWAIRYEPGFFNTYIMPLYTASKFDITEAKARAMSWGLMQIMGQSARETGYTGDLPALCDPVIGLDVGCKIFAHKLSITGGNVIAALFKYNGGKNQNYAPEVLARQLRYIDA